DQQKYQFGKSKIFFRAGLVAYLEKLRSDKLRSACVSIQKTIRCWLARRKYLRMRESAIIIQKHVRAHQARRRAMEAVVLLQSCVRRMMAKKELKKLKVEARSVEHFKKLNVGMENKILQLQHKINEQHKEHGELTERLSVLEKTHTTEREKQCRDIENLRRSEQEARAKAETVPSLLEQLSFLQEELENTRREKEDLEVQTKTFKERTQETIHELNMKNSLLNSNIEELNEEFSIQAQQLKGTGAIES
ncbi:hypothetical protein XENOCAPTIV_001235, partial [Xenoophorus captivus]